MDSFCMGGQEKIRRLHHCSPTVQADVLVIPRVDMVVIDKIWMAGWPMVYRATKYYIRDVMEKLRYRRR